MSLNKFKLKIKYLISLMLFVSEVCYAAPFHACTPFKERLIGTSWPGGLHTGCANFQVNYGACTITKHTWFGDIHYGGAQVSGYLPDYIIEVTPYFGMTSYSQDIDGALITAQMALAVSTWEKSNPGSAPVISNGADESQEDTGQAYSKSLYGRMVASPFENPVWAFSMFGVPVGQTTGEIAGLAGISEMDPVTWNDSDVVPDPDKYISVPLLPATTFMCHGPMSVASGVINTASSAIAQINPGKYAPPRSGAPVIAMPVLQEAALYADLLPDSDALAFTQDPTRMCMGNLGALLPRSGYSDVSDSFRASQTAAWRIASLTYDHFSAPFGTHAGGVLPGDKWQIIWPPVYPTSTMCFTPGSVATPPLNIAGSAVYGQVTPARGFMDTLVVMVWRYHSACEQPWDGPGDAAEIVASYPARAAACRAINAVDGMP